MSPLDDVRCGVALRTVAADLQFPEGPVALPDGSFLVVEMAGQRLTQLDADGHRLRSVVLGGGPNGAAVGPDGCVYVCNNGGQNWRHEGELLLPAGQSSDYEGGRIQRVDLSRGTIETVVEHTASGPLKGPNDLVFDREGGLWFTDMGKTRGRDMDRGGVYYCPPDGSGAVEAIFPMMQPNGIGLSPDERTLYVVETITSRLWAFCLVRPGVIAAGEGPAPHGGRLVATLPDYRLPDSLAVDASGAVCIATLMCAGITTVEPDSGRMTHHPMPDRFTTNVCFGGTGLRTAYITLSSSGRLVAMDWGDAGLPLNFQHWI